MIPIFRTRAAVCAMIAGGSAVFAVVSASAHTNSSLVQAAPNSTAYCRQAPALFALAPEPAFSQNRQDYDEKAFRAAPAPPPPIAAAEGYSDAVRRSPPARPAAAAPARVRAEGSVTERAAPSVGVIYPPRPPRPPHHPPQPPVQSGLLTAGEHDDILNSKLYAAYVRDSQLGQVIADLPLVDTRHMLRVDVKDSKGRAVSFADVVVTCSDGNTLSLKTHMNGSAIFFAGIDRLSPTISIEARSQGRAISAPQNLRVSTADGGQHVTLAARPVAAHQANTLDLMLVIDTTGSMGDEIRYLQAELASIVQDLKARHRQLDVRIGFVFYRDEGDAYVTQTVDFEGNISKASDILGRQSAGGGGDYPEAMDQALIRAVGASWRKDSVKSLVLVADAPPHDDKFGRTWAATEAARAKHIQITPVAASGVGDKAEYVMRAMAAVTQSRYIFLTDDSGVGNTHAPPAVACYVVTRLDALLRRVIDSQVSGKRIEPQPQEIIRTVGQYDQGKCALPNDFRWQ